LIFTEFLMVRTLTSLTSLRPFTAAARRAASLLKSAGRQSPANEPLFEALEERTLLAADVTATLTVPALTALASAGGTLSGSIVLTNTGTTAATGFTYRVFLSADSIIGNEDDVELNPGGAVATLAGGPNANSVHSTTVNLNAYAIPADVRPGAYFVITTLDTANVVSEGEAGEANNTVRTVTPIIVLNGAAGSPNVTAAVTFVARTINPDQHISVPTTIRNLGTSAATNFHITWVLSTDAVIGNADDIAIDEEDVATLAAGGTLTLTRDIQLPVGIALGAYRLGVWADDRADVAETNEGDNRAVTATAALTVGLPDLSATFTTTGGTIAPGGFFTGTLTVRNNTQALATPFSVFICLSTDGVAGNDDDILLLSVDITDPALTETGLAGGAIRTITNLRVYIPYGSPAGGALDPGAYRVSVVVDPTDEVNESVENNNATISATNILTIPARNTANDPDGADLFGYAYPITGSFQPGQTINVAAIFANLGNAQATGGVTMSAYFSTDAVLDGGDLLMSSDVFDGDQATFDVGSIYGNISLVIPAAAPNGNFFIIFVADEPDSVTETNDANNNASTGTATVTRATVSITAPDAAAGESTGTANPGQFRITRTGATTTDLMVMYTVTGTAAAGDYNAASFTGMVTIPAGATFVNIDLTVTDDALGENDETVIVSLDADDYYTLSATQNSATVTIADNEPRVSITAVDAAAGESSGTANPGQFRVTRTGSTAGALVVTYTVTGTATADDDYTALTGTVTIPAGSLTATFNVNVLQDAVSEPSETVIVTLDPGAAYSVSATQDDATVTIADDEPTVTVTASDPAAGEATGTLNPGAFTITRTGATTDPLTVNYTVTGTATGGTDYTTLTGTAIIPAGSTHVIVNVTVTQDAVAEPSETVIVTLDADDSYNLSTTPALRTATVTIADDEPVVSLTVVDATAAESSGTANPGQFRVTRTGATGTALTVHYTMTGTAVNGTDYTLLTGTVVIPIGASTATFNVNVTDDALAENTETVTATLDTDAAYNVTTVVAQQQGTLTIADNEPIVTITTADATAGETFAGQVANNGQFRVSRPSTNVAGDLVVHYTVTGTATNGTDYTTLTGTVTILNGQSSATFNVVPTDDLDSEVTETVIVTLDADNAYNLSPTLTLRTATVTIADDEPVVTITATDAAAGEVVAGGVQNPGNFRVTRTGGDQSQQLTINVVVSGTASNGDWINFIVDELVIPAGQSFYDNPVIAVDDDVFEGLENITITLQDGDGYHVTTTAAQRAATVTIADNESTVSVTAQDATAAEIPTGTPNPGAFRITRAIGSTAAALRVYFTLSGTAVNGTDYNAVGGSTLIPAGATFADVPINVIDDLLGEGTENVIITLTADPTYQLTTTLAQRTATVTIADNEPTVTITAADAAAAEVGTGTANPGQFRVTRTGPTTTALVVNYTMTGTATNGTDYTTLTGTVTIPIGATSATFNVAVTEDNLAEPTETVIATLAADAAYLLGTAATRTATVNITDNAATVTVAATDAAGAEVFTGAANHVVYRITRTGATTSALVVNYTMSGTASGGTDYTAVSGTATIPIGAAFVDVTLDVLDDLIVEGAETAILTLTADPSYRLGTAAQQTAAATIADNEPTFAVVTVDAAGAEVPSGVANPVSYRINRTGGNGQTSVVNFSMTGSATPGVDYTLTMTPVAGAVFAFDPVTGLGTVTFGAAVTTVTLIATPALDTTAETTETAVVNLDAADVGAQQYTVSGTQHSATASITNAVFADLAAISIGGFDDTSFSRTGVGQQVTFDLNVENQGTTTLTSVRATLFLQSAGGVRTNIGTGTFTVNLATGQATTLHITFTLSGFPAVGTYTPGATVAIVTGGTDAIAGNNVVLGTPASVDVTA
jgi:carbon monoxide dehydrogenase subunit G